MQYQWIIITVKGAVEVFFLKQMIFHTQQNCMEKNTCIKWNRKKSHVSASQCSVTIPPLWDKETEWAKVSLFR